MFGKFRRARRGLLIAALLASFVLIGSGGSAQAAVTPSVSIKVSSKMIFIGDRVTVSGSVSQKSQGAEVRLQQHTDDWHTIKTSKVSSKKTYKFRPVVSKAKTSYRVVVMKNKNVKKKASATARIIGLTPPTPTELANARDIILQKTNEKRIANGRLPLSAWPGLDSVSQHWTQYMAASGNFKHNPDYATQYPSECNGAKAENIAAGQTIESVVEAWWKSPGHKANILDARFTHLGIGYAVNPNDPNKYYRYFTQNFCQQK